MSDWQPMETAPKDGRHLLLFGWYVYPVDYYEKQKSPIVISGQWWVSPHSQEGFWIAVSERETCEIFHATHWMPSPPPPETAA